MSETLNLYIVMEHVPMTFDNLLESFKKDIRIEESHIKTMLYNSIVGLK